VQSYELRYPAMAIANGIDPASKQTVAFAIGNKTYADSLQATVLAPLVAQGLDMAWTDWQQGFPGVESIRGLVPTAMLNHYRFHNFTAVRTCRSLSSFSRAPLNRCYGVTSVAGGGGSRH
jgi:hypothetical protein